MYFAHIFHCGNFDSLDTLMGRHKDMGGGTVHLKHLVLALGKAGHEIDIITQRCDDLGNGVFSEPFEECYHGVENVRIVRLNFDPIGLYIGKTEVYPHTNRIASVINKFYQEQGKWPDIFFVHYNAAMTGVFLQHLTGIPFTWTPHELGVLPLMKMLSQGMDPIQIERLKHYFLKTIGERVAASWAGRIITFSDWENNVLRSSPYHDLDLEDKFCVVGCGVDREIFYPDIHTRYDTPLELNDYLIRDIDADRWNLPLLICACRLSWTKNQVNLLHAYANNEELQRKANLLLTVLTHRDLWNEEPDNSLEGQVASELLKLIRSYRLKGKVVLAPAVSQKELADFYRWQSTRGSIYVLPSKVENYPQSVIEAICCGLPVAVTNNSGIASFVQNRFGLTFDPYNPSDIASTILTIISSPEIHHLYQTNCISEGFDYFSWDRVALEYVQIAKDILRQQKMTEGLPIPVWYDRGITLSEYEVMELAEDWTSLLEID